MSGTSACFFPVFLRAGLEEVGGKILHQGLVKWKLISAYLCLKFLLSHKIKFTSPSRFSWGKGGLYGSGPWHKFCLPSPDSKNFMAFYPVSFFAVCRFHRWGKGRCSPKSSLDVYIFGIPSNKPCAPWLPQGQKQGGPLEKKVSVNLRGVVGAKSTWDAEVLCSVTSSMDVYLQLTWVGYGHDGSAPKFGDFFISPCLTFLLMSPTVLCLSLWLAVRLLWSCRSWRWLGRP